MDAGKDGHLTMSQAYNGKDPGDIRILVGFEHTGALSGELRKLGFTVHTCDLKPSLSAANHIQGDFFLRDHSRYDVIIAFYPCTYLAKAGLHWCNDNPDRCELRDRAVEDVKRLMSLDVQHIAVENPTGYLSTAYRHPDQLVFPWYFGDPYRKEINLWLKNLPPLMSTCISTGRQSVSNHVNGRMSQDLKSEVKSSWLWYPRMCKAIAQQWGSYLLKN